MRVFISSLITGMEQIRSTVRGVVAAFRHEPVMAEDFGARPQSPQVACLSELRGSDLVVLIMGGAYGAPQESGLSATHEEYREAKESKPVIALVQEGVARDAQQAEFVAEVQAWEGGLFRAAFQNEEELRSALTRALSDYGLATAAGPIDEAGLVERASALLPASQRGFASSTTLSVAIAGGPRQRLLRPIELEDPTLAEALHQAALFGPTQIFDRTEGVQHDLEGAALVLRQGGDVQVRLEEDGAILAQLSLDDPREQPSRGGSFTGMMLVEETVQQRLVSALAYCSWALDRIDRTQKLTQLGIACQVLGAEHRRWANRAEASQIALSGSMTMGMGDAGAEPVSVTVRRAALNLGANRVVEDLLVPLRRRWSRRR